MSTKLPALKNIPPKTDRELKLALDAIKESLEIRLGQRGDPLDRAVTLRELKDSGIVKVSNSTPGVSEGIQPPDEDPPGNLTTPTSPTNLTASAAFTSITLGWTKANYGNHAYTEIWRSKANALGGATLLSTTNAFVYTDEVGYNQEYYYWVRYVSTSDVPGSFNDTEGTSATTATDVGAVMQSLSENLQNLPGYSTLTTLIDTESAVAARVIKSSSAPTTRADSSALQANDIWYDTDDGQVHTRNGANDAWVAARDATLVNLYGSTSFTGSTITGAMAAAQADIVTVTNAQSSTASSLSSLTSTVNTNTANIATEQTTRANADTALSTDITNLTAVVDVKNQTFVQTSAPTAIAAGDLWIDSDDDNKLYRATGAGTSNWVVVRDTANDGKATIFTQDAVPTSGVKKGDIWFDTNDSNRQYRADSDGSDQVTSGEWEEVRDVTTQAALTSEASTRAAADTANSTAITNLTATVNAKNQTFVQDNAPTAVATGDLWVDSNDENKLYRWDGSAWAVVRDTANDSKTTVFTQASQPTAENTGDIWFDTDDSNKQYRWDGSSWVVVRDVLTQAGVTTVQNAISNGTSAEAGYGVAVNANGAVAGMYIMAASDGTLENNTSTTNIIFEADQVTIRDSNSGGTNIQPFTVLTSTDGNGNAPGVYMDAAFIKNAAISAAQIGTVNADTITTGSMSAARITSGTMDAARISGGVIQSTDLSTGGATTINGDNITTGGMSANRITSDQLDSARINVDTLNVKHFDNVSSDIKSHTGTFVPLGVEANVQSWSGTYPGQTIVSSETSSVVNIGCTVSNVRNNAKYRVVYSAVLGDVRKGTIQYSFDNSTWVSLSPTVNANAGTYRTYVFLWDGQITTMSSSQNTVYWRITWNVTGGQVNSTYQALYVTMDNTQ